MLKQAGYGKGAFYLDKDGIPIDRRKHEKHLENEKEKKRKGEIVCSQ